MTLIERKIYETGLIPVIKIEDPKVAVPLAKALIDGGLPAAEVTFRTACAAEAISAMAKAYPDMLIGAGTVLTPEQADRAIAAGASFIVSPGLNPRVVKHCQSKGVPIIPGCSSPTDIETALELGLTTVKFFPAEAAGGLPMLKAMAAPYGNVRFMPTGGIDTTNLLSYLKFNKIIACGGSFMVKDDLIKAGDFAAITALARKAVLTMLDFEFLHLGMNNPTEEAGKAGADRLSELFGWAQNEGAKGIFVGDAFEVMKLDGVGTRGHIAIKTSSVDRAIAYFSRMGVEFDESSKTYFDDGRCKFVYFKEEFCGFAIHLLQK